MSLVKYEFKTIPGFNADQQISISVGAKLSALPGEPGGRLDTHWVGEAGGSGVKGHATASVRHQAEIGKVRYTFSVDAVRIDGRWRIDSDFRRELGLGGKPRPVTKNAAEQSHQKVEDVLLVLRNPEYQDRINEIASWDARRQMIEHRERLQEAVASMVVIEHERDEPGIEGKWER